MAGLLSLPEILLDDDPLEVAEGDIFFSPDFFAEGIVHAGAVFADWSAKGVEINFMVYDLLPLLLPQCFPGYAEDAHAKWLCAVAESGDRLICISRAVAEDTRRWLNAHRPEALQDLEITVSHLGADIDVLRRVKRIARRRGPRAAEALLSPKLLDGGNDRTSKRTFAGGRSFRAPVE